MGWGNCGTDSEGRPIGYVFPAVCDHPDCKTKIDRGLGYVCGRMHGDGEYSCERYFCENHKVPICTPEDEHMSVCDACAELLIFDDDMNVIGFV